MIGGSPARARPYIEAKVVLLGESSVGKTCLVSRFITGMMPNGVEPTLGACYASTKLPTPNGQCLLQIWDTSGQDRYRSLAPIYYRGARVVLLVFSIVDVKSFEAIDYWVTSLRDNTGGVSTLFLIGNKLDLEAERIVPLETAQQKAAEINAQYLETSAVNGTMIATLFENVANACTPDIPALEGEKAGDLEPQQSEGCAC